VDFIPNEHLGVTEDDRKVIFDISARCSNGETLIIEMQKGYQMHFRKRALYYTTYPINEQARDARDRFIKAMAAGEKDAKFDWDYNLKPVTVVAILNFSFKHFDNEWPKDMFRSSYRLREDGNHEIMTDVLRFVFLELGRFRKRIWEIENRFDKWVYLLKHMHEMSEIPKEFSDPLFTRLFMLAEIDNFTAEERKQYLKSLDDMGDYLNTINTAVEEAEIRGRAMGREEGEVAKAVEIARKLVANGMSKSEAAEFVGIPEAMLAE
jgi:predicted transposase/invertase (TIGR01784 family)